jgi:hypothetical protein
MIGKGCASQERVSKIVFLSKPVVSREAFGLRAIYRRSGNARKASVFPEVFVRSKAPLKPAQSKRAATLPAILYWKTCHVP